MAKAKRDPTFQQRYERSEQALLEEGGKRLNLRLSGKGVKAVERLQKRTGLSTYKDCIELALSVASGSV
jgi:hypothetical protein